MTLRFARRAYVLTHRPRIVVRNVVVDGIGKEGDIDRGLSIRNGSLWLSNIGENQAIVLKVWTTLTILEFLPMRNPANDVVTQDQLQITIPPGGVAPIPIEDLKIESYSDYVAVRDGRNNANLYVIGFVKYSDSIGTFRRTYFCRRFDRTTARFKPIRDPDYEYCD